MIHDVVIAGGGPAALALAVALADEGLGVCVIGGEDVAWPANYGGWVDELTDVGLGEFVGPVWSDAVVVFDDATTLSTGRAYARVARDRLRSHLLARCAALGVNTVWGQRAATLVHDATGSTLTTDAGVIVRASVAIDATGHNPRFVARQGKATTFQAAVGVLGTPVGDGLDVARMTFMDLRSDHVDDALGQSAPTFLYTMPLSPDRVFVEETSLVRGPAVPFDVLGARLNRRLAGLGVHMDAVEGTERCLIPMDNPVPDLNQRVIGFGGAASMVHPATGYLLARAFSTAPELASTIADGLRGGLQPEAVSRAAWRTIWTDDDLLRRELHLFGSQILAELDAAEQRAFFGPFFSMPQATWAGYLSGRGDVASVVRAMASLLVHSGFRIRWKLLRSGARLPRVLLRAV